MNQGTTDGALVQLKATDVLQEILQQGAQRMLAAAIENEVAEYLQRHSHQRDADGKRLVVRNGHKPERFIQTGLGPLAIPAHAYNAFVDAARAHQDGRHGSEYAR